MPIAYANNHYKQNEKGPGFPRSFSISSHQRRRFDGRFYFDTVGIQTLGGTLHGDAEILVAFVAGDLRFMHAEPLGEFAL
jgi:hypothetical protein